MLAEMAATVEQVEPGDLHLEPVTLEQNAVGMVVMAVMVVAVVAAPYSEIMALAATVAMVVLTAVVAAVALRAIKRAASMCQVVLAVLMAGMAEKVDRGVEFAASLVKTQGLWRLVMLNYSPFLRPLTLFPRYPVVGRAVLFRMIH